MKKTLRICLIFAGIAVLMLITFFTVGIVTKGFGPEAFVEELEDICNRKDESDFKKLCGLKGAQVVTIPKDYNSQDEIYTVEGFPVVISKTVMEPAGGWKVNFVYDRIEKVGTGKDSYRIYFHGLYWSQMDVGLFGIPADTNPELVESFYVDVTKKGGKYHITS